MIMLQFFRKVHAVEVENGRHIIRDTVLALAVVEEGTTIGFHAVL